jgi:translocator protein
MSVLQCASQGGRRLFSLARCTARLHLVIMDTFQRPPAWQHALIAIAAVVATSFLGNMITTPQIPGWYAALAKPSFNPPNWAFPVAWTLLFTMIAIAGYRIMRTEADAPGRALALRLFFGQLLLNVSWSAAFFGMKSPLAGLVVIGPFLVAIIWMIMAFRPLDRLAASLMIPYAAWVGFATILNGAIWWLNR